ncbi:MAG TPA: tripartite tricarboxylate transporter TctB family protein [Burkholderiales bacterium]
MKIKSPQDFWAGLMFIAFGVFFLVVAQLNYQMGTAVRMGPGYFPTVLGGILAVLGAIVLTGSLAVEGPPVAKLHFRPLIFILISSLAFAYLLKPLGLVLSGMALVFISAYGGHEFKWKEVAILSVVLVIFSVLVFVKALVLPFPICPDFIEVCPIR